MRDLVLAFVCIANSCNPFSSMRVGSRAGPCNSAGLARMLPSHRSHPAPIPSPKRCFGASRMALSPQSLSKRFSPTTNEDREEGPDEEEVDEEEEEQEGDDDYVMILSDIEEAVLFAGAHPGDVDANELIQVTMTYTQPGLYPSELETAGQKTGSWSLILATSFDKDDEGGRRRYRRSTGCSPC